MKFETLYRRILHAELDILLDVSKTVRVGPYEQHDKMALAERTARKWAMDSFLMAAIVAPYGKDRVVESLNSEIAKLRRMIEIRKEAMTTDPEFTLETSKFTIAQNERAIVLIEEMITKL